MDIFTSRVFDDFDILSRGVYFSHEYGEDEDWILKPEKFSSGTSVWMKLNNHIARAVSDDASRHPDIELREMNANDEVKRMIKRVRG